MSISEIQKQTEYKMNRTVETLREDFIKIRTGRASTGLLDHVMVDYYGTMTPINQVAQVGVADARTLTVQPWEKSMVAPVEKAIRSSDLGLNSAVTPTNKSRSSPRLRKSLRTMKRAPARISKSSRIISLKPLTSAWLKKKKK